MQRALILGLLLSMRLAAQTLGSAPADGFLPQTTPSAADSTETAPSADLSDSLPDAPGAVAERENVVALGEASLKASGKIGNTCNAWRAMRIIHIAPDKTNEPPPPCAELVYPYQRFLDSKMIVPLNWKQKGYLALHFATDPAGVGTIAGISAINIGIDSHTAYGPGMKGYGKLVGVSLLQNTTGEFFGTFAIPSLMHQDPRYFRQPDKPVGKRILYSISHTFVARSDSGKTIPNYGTLATYPIATGLANLYVPGIHNDAESTTERILTGLALDPVNNLVNEFLPDVASRIHVRVIFVQQILNNIAAAPGAMP